MKNLVYCLIFLALGFACGRRCTPVRQTERLRVDTIRIVQPQVRDSIMVRVERIMVPVQRIDTVMIDHPIALYCDSDSVQVAIPIVQKEYADTAYRVWVSGYQPRLDSIHIYQPRSIAAAQKRWHLGISAGYAASPSGLRPYLGVGITYSFFSF